MHTGERSCLLHPNQCKGMEWLTAPASSAEQLVLCNHHPQPGNFSWHEQCTHRSASPHGGTELSLNQIPRTRTCKQEGLQPHEPHTKLLKLPAPSTPAGSRAAQEKPPWAAAAAAASASSTRPGPVHSPELQSDLGEQRQS